MIYILLLLIISGLLFIIYLLNGDVEEKEKEINCLTSELYKYQRQALISKTSEPKVSKNENFND